MSIPPSASVPYRLPVVPSVAGPEALAGLGVNHDALAVSPKMLDLELVALGTENIHCIGRQAVFDENSIGEPLMMKPGRVDGFLNVKREIDNADEDVGNGSYDGGAAGRAENEEELAVFEHDGRRHGGERALARADGVGGALNESVGVRDALLGGEVVHLVVEQETQTFCGDAGAEGIVERSGYGNGVAFSIDYGIVRGVLGLANGLVRLSYALQFTE